MFNIAAAGNECSGVGASMNGSSALPGRLFACCSFFLNSRDVSAMSATASCIATSAFSSAASARKLSVRKRFQLIHILASGSLMLISHYTSREQRRERQPVPRLGLWIEGQDRLHPRA